MHTSRSGKPLHGIATASRPCERTDAVGAGWKRTSQAGRDYLSLRLDDPSLAEPINANLIEVDSEYRLIWAR